MGTGLLDDFILFMRRQMPNAPSDDFEKAMAQLEARVTADEDSDGAKFIELSGKTDEFASKLNDFRQDLGDMGARVAKLEKAGVDVAALTNDIADMKAALTSLDAVGVDAGKAADVTGTATAGAGGGGTSAGTAAAAQLEAVQQQPVDPSPASVATAIGLTAATDPGATGAAPQPVDPAPAPAAGDPAPASTTAALASDPAAAPPAT